MILVTAISIYLILATSTAYIYRAVFSGSWWQISLAFTLWWVLWIYGALQIVVLVYRMPKF